MTILPIDPVANATPEALRAFLDQCRQVAVRDGRPKLISISIAVDALDPLAVLESIFEPGELHFYAEHPLLDTAIAGAEAVLVEEASGPGRFSAVQRFVDQTLADTIAVGDVNAAFGGPHFFAGFSFHDEVAADEPFPAARVFVPRWQVARAGGRTTAVANLVVTPDADIAALTERVWRAHAKFRNFDYRSGPIEFGGGSSESGTGVSPVGLGEGRSGTGVSPVGLGGAKGNSDHGRDAHATPSHAGPGGEEFQGKSGTGVPPVGLGGAKGNSDHGRDAHATPSHAGPGGEEFQGKSGTGVSPVGLGEGKGTTHHGQVARAAGGLIVKQGAFLPHWTREGSIYAVTFRLADSLPASALQALRSEQAASPPSRGQRTIDSIVQGEEASRLRSARIESYLDSGVGACYLARPDIAAMVASALQHFDGVRYELHDWCVMPNHVHVIIRPLGTERLEEILHSWKSYTAKVANQALGRDGDFWQAEYYDHVIRDEAEYLHAADYIRRNPDKAGLVNWRWLGCGKSGTGVPPVGLVGAKGNTNHGRDAHATPSHAGPGEEEFQGRSGTGVSPVGLAGAKGNTDHGRDAHATPSHAGPGEEEFQGKSGTGVPPVGLGEGQSGTGVSPVGLAGAKGNTDHGRDAHATSDRAAHTTSDRAAHATINHGRDAHATPAPAEPATDVAAEATIQEAGDFREAVSKALARIAAGEFRKIVLARAKVLTASHPLHPLEMLNALRQRFADCYAFSIANGRGQSFIGATPERLARVSRGLLETEALAGSAPRGSRASEDAQAGTALMRSEKDRYEQKLVIDSICRRLAGLGLTPTFPAEPILRKLANVQHLHTPISAVLPESVRLLDVLARLHPTPAVGGSPREAAVARIRELEGFPRGLYAGALGWLNARGGGEFFVGLRSALVEGPTATMFAGAGIVAGSSPEKELAETELKFQAMHEALQSG